MDSTENGHRNGEIQEEFSFHKHDIVEVEEEVENSGSSNGRKLRDFIPVYVPAIENGLIDTNHRKKRFFDFLRARPENNWFLKFKFNRGIRRRRTGSASGSGPDTSSSEATPSRPWRQRFRVRFVRKINWKALMQHFKSWIKHPANVALFIWLILCAIGIILYFLLILGALDDVVTGHETRKKWEEVVNQVLNALFTFMCIYQHPNIFHHLLLVLRWRPDDQVAARHLYSKNGIQRPHLRAHILFVVSLLHITCFAQYVYCALFWGWSRKNRPEWPQYVCLGVGTVAPVYAAWYVYYGPLGKNTGTDEPRIDEESTNNHTPETEVEMIRGRVIVTSPEWIGGLFDCRDDKTGFFLSGFCTFCVFGWNLERLGFGNMYVHIVTFLLLCISPFLIFNMSAINVNDDNIRVIVAIAGAVCCLFGLLYGGYWRSEIRNKFKLPGNPFCCGYPLLTDYMQWFFCCCCSLAQEVRTANFYDIEDDNFYRRVNDEEGRSVLVPLPREGNMMEMNSIRSFSSPPNLGGISHIEMPAVHSPIELSVPFGRASTYSKVHALKPPFQQVMQTENE